MMSQSACFGNSSPEPLMVPEGQRETQSRQDDIREIDELRKGQKRVRFKREPLIDKPAGPSSQEEDVELSIISWNIHNQNPYGFREQFLKMGAHIWIIQEGHKSFQNGKKALGFRWFTKERKDKQLMIGVIPIIKGRRREELETPNSMVIEIWLGSCSILIGNIHQTEIKGEYRILLNKLKDSFSVCGADLNSKPKREVVRFDILSDLITRIKSNRKMEWKNKNLENGSKIDFLFIHQGIRYYQKCKTEFIRNGEQIVSDHKPLAVDIQVKRSDSMAYPVIDAKMARRLYCRWNQEESKWELRKEFARMTVRELIEKNMRIEPEVKMIRFMRPKYQEWNEEFQEKIKVMERCEKGKFHRFVQHTTQIRAEKEGGIVNIMSKNGEIITDYKMILHECIEKMKRVSEELTQEDERPWKHQRRIDLNMEDLGEYSTANFLDVVNQEGENIEWFNRAISFDFIHLTVLRQITKRDFKENNKIDQDLLDLDVWEQNDYCLAQRLIPLNKIAPQIAGVNDIRPIMVQSHLVKFMEWSFMKAFKQANSLRVDPCQIGFTSKLGTQVHISQLVDRMKRKGSGKSFVFFDLSDAYNTIHREAAHHLIKIKKIIDEDRLNFLFNVYDQLYVYDPILKKKVRFKNGVQQGSALSPFIFNIFFENVIAKTKQKINEKINQLKKNQKNMKRWMSECEILAYADDVVIISRNKVAGELAKTFCESADYHGLVVNVKKTKYLANREIKDLELMKVQKVESFRYLGTWLTMRGGLKFQFEKTKKLVTMKSQQMGMLRKLVPFRTLVKLWTLYVLPHIRYHNMSIWKQKKSTILQWQILKRNSFRKVMGLNKSFPRFIIDGIVGRLEYDLNEEGYLRRQLRIALFRKHLYYYEPEGFSWLDALKLYNVFLWSQFKHMDAKMFDVDEEQHNEYRDLILGFLDQNDDYNLKLTILNQEFDELDKKEQLVTKDDEKKSGRRVQNQVIRRIPGYEFFEPFKHGWRRCIQHNKNMTAKHMMDSHLFGEPGCWQDKLERILQYVGEISKPFYSKTQKSMREIAQKLAKRIRSLVETECEPFQKKKKANLANQ